MRFALIEDERIFYDSFKSILERYSKENNLEISLSHFYDAESFLKSYKCEYSLIFIDINLNGINGLECAKMLREKGDNVLIIFVTNFAKFAVKGYEVNAIDFIVKPIIYQDFVLKLSRAIRVIKNSKTENNMIIRDGIGFVKIPINNLMYIEVIKHYIYFHLVDKVVKVRGVFSEYETKLANSTFIRCNKSFIINTDYLTAVKGQKVLIGDYEIAISQNLKKGFMQKLADIINYGNGLI